MGSQILSLKARIGNILGFVGQRKNQECDVGT